VKLYSELAGWWHLLSDPEDYEEEARIFVHAILEHAGGEVRSLLELGCGGGNNASHMKQRFEMTLTDLSEPMLEQSRRLNPTCEHIQGDMRTLRLGRSFDAVFVHDAVSYMTTEADLGAAMRTASEHLEPGGVARFGPDATAESFRPGTSSGCHDDGRRSLRYLHWEHPAEAETTTHDVTFV
jgi:predicted TPR repeat methyltransferase